MAAAADPPAPFIPRKDSICGFVYGVETGRLREVSQAPAGDPGEAKASPTGIPPGIPPVQ